MAQTPEEFHWALARPSYLEGMAEIRTVTTLRRKRDEIAASIRRYEQQLAQARADLAHDGTCEGLAVQSSKSNVSLRAGRTKATTINASSPTSVIRSYGGR
jgi:hypothetical protein